MNILKEKIAKAISNHVSLEDTYTYELKRAKAAFEVGTMSLEDFEEWTEENVDDLAESIVDALQPQLNENQKNKTNNNLLKINDLAFDLQHDDELTVEQFWKVKQIFELSLQYQLDENQQIVLEWLKEEQTKNPELTIFGTLSVLFDESENRFMNLDVIDALNNLSNLQQEGVFQAFSEWTLGQEEENVISRK